MKRGLYWIIVLTAAFSCTSSDPEAPKTQLLTQNTWLFSFGTSTDPTTQTLIPLLYGSVYNFYTDHTYHLTVQGILATNTVWEFSSDETKIIFQKGTVDERTVKIITLSATELHFQEDDGTIKTDYYYVKKA